MGFFSTLAVCAVTMNVFLSMHVSKDSLSLRLKWSVVCFVVCFFGFVVGVFLNSYN